MSAGRNWLLGCGIGCGIVLLIFVLVAGGSFYMLRDAIHGFKQLEESQTALVEEHGRISDFQPRPDGRIPAERVVAFLAVRDTTSAKRDALARALNVDVPAMQGEGRKGLAKLFRGLKAGFGFTGTLADYLRARGAALVDQKMGLGEYLYTYSLVYYSWLGKDPGAGPSEMKIDYESKRDGHVMVWGEEHGDWSKPEVRRQRLRLLVHDHLLPMLESQLAAAEPAADPAWRRELAAEIDRLRADPARLPWQDGLPAPLRESLEPHRAQLEAQWSDAANMLEILTLEDRESRGGKSESARREEV
jgi:hypothetical protein